MYSYTFKYTSGSRVPVIDSSETRDDGRCEGKFLLGIVAMWNVKVGTMPSRNFLA